MRSKGQLTDFPWSRPTFFIDGTNIQEERQTDIFGACFFMQQ